MRCFPRCFKLIGGLLAMGTGLFLLGGIEWQTLACAWGVVFTLAAVITAMANIPD